MAMTSTTSKTITMMRTPRTRTALVGLAAAALLSLSACGSENDSLVSGPGNDLLRGGSGDDELFGISGRDTLFGGEGDDVLDGWDAFDPDDAADLVSDLSDAVPGALESILGAEGLAQAGRVQEALALSNDNRGPDELDGVDFWRLDEAGLIQEMTVLWRPLPAIMAVVGKLNAAGGEPS